MYYNFVNKILIDNDILYNPDFDFSRKMVLGTAIVFELLDNFYEKYLFIEASKLFNYKNNYN